MSEKPFVSILTPVYNGEAFIAACIESVLAQTYTNFEYVIVNNRSTDRTLEIARSYAVNDRRIRVEDCETFVGVIENHNRALSLASPASKYCKIVSADDWILPECVEKMVALAETNPSVGLVGSYAIAGTKVMNTGLPFNTNVVKGHVVCRASLLGGPYVFGSPSSLMYRADLTRQTNAFFPNPNPHSDTTACYEVLQQSDFGFVHQILTGTRVHSGSETSKSFKHGTLYRALLADLARYGPIHLTPEELKSQRDEFMAMYYEWLIAALYTNRKDPKFWAVQKAELEEAGIHVSYAKLALGALARGFHTVLEIVADPRMRVQRILRFVRQDAKKVKAEYYT